MNQANFNFIKKKYFGTKNVFIAYDESSARADFQKQMQKLRNFKLLRLTWSFSLEG